MKPSSDKLIFLGMPPASQRLTGRGHGPRSEACHHPVTTPGLPAVPMRSQHLLGMGWDLTHLCRAIRLPRGMRSSQAEAMSTACTSRMPALPDAGGGTSGWWGRGGGLGDLGAAPGAPVRIRNKIRVTRTN